MVASSDAAEAARIEREQGERPEPDGEIENVGHGGLRNWFQSSGYGFDRVKSRLRMTGPYIKKT